LKANFKRLPLMVVSLTAIISLILAFFTTNPIVLMLLIEISATSVIYFLFISIIPAIRPEKVNVEDIFMCGAAKPPYLSADEAYRVKIPFAEEEES